MTTLTREQIEALERYENALAREEEAQEQINAADRKLGKAHSQEIGITVPCSPAPAAPCSTPQGVAEGETTAARVAPARVELAVSEEALQCARIITTDYPAWYTSQTPQTVARELLRLKAALPAVVGELAEWKAGGSRGTIAEWRRDAERYRWLHNGDVDGLLIMRGYVDHAEDIANLIGGDELDAAIDSAMRGTK